MLELQRSVCAFCRATLKPDEVYACEKCAEENAPPELKEVGNDSQTPQAPEL